MKKIKLKDVVVFIISVILVLGATFTMIFCAIPIEKEIDKEMYGIIFEAYDIVDEHEPVYVRIKGTYTNYIFNISKEDSFAGEIILSDKPIPDDAVGESCTYVELTGNYVSMLVKDIRDNTKEKYRSTVMFDRTYTNFSFGLGNDIVICPANNLDDAMYNALKLYEGTGAQSIIRDTSISVLPNKNFN